MDKFKKIKFDVRYSSCVSTHEGTNVEPSEVMKILSDQRVIKFTATRMTTREALELSRKERESHE